MGGSSSKKTIGEVFPEDESSSNNENSESDSDTEPKYFLKYKGSRDFPPELEDVDMSCRFLVGSPTQLI